MNRLSQAWYGSAFKIPVLGIQCANRLMVSSYKFQVFSLCRCTLAGQVIVTK